MTARPAIVAHRGWATRYPENTLQSLSAALAAGVSHVEFDVQLTADGVPLLIHDATLERTAGRPDSVLDLPWSRLAGITVRREGDDETAPGAPLPSLAEAVRMLRDHPEAVAFVELKRHSIERFGAADCVARCLAELRPLGTRAVLTSFEAAALTAADAHCPVAWVLRQYDEAALERARRLAPNYLFCNHEKLPPDGSNLPAGPWSWVIYEVRTAALARALAGRGAAFVETMAVGELLAELRAKGDAT
jgi:glycerophosphoryl diester phosphodiesterase